MGLAMEVVLLDVFGSVRAEDSIGASWVRTWQQVFSGKREGMARRQREPVGRDRRARPLVANGVGGD